MQAQSDEQRIDTLERKVDEGFAKVDEGFAEMRREFKDVRADMRQEINMVRSEARADFRTLIAILLPMYLTIILGFAALLLQRA